MKKYLMALIVSFWAFNSMAESRSYFCNGTTALLPTTVELELGSSGYGYKGTVGMLGGELVTLEEAGDTVFLDAGSVSAWSSGNYKVGLGFDKDGSSYAIECGRVKR